MCTIDLSIKDNLYIYSYIQECWLTDASYTKSLYEYTHDRWNMSLLPDACKFKSEKDYTMFMLGLPCV